MKDQHKLELQTPETMKLFGVTKKLIVFELVLKQLNLVDNRNHLKSEVLYTNKSYAYLVNVESSNLVVLSAWYSVLILKEMFCQYY